MDSKDEGDGVMRVRPELGQFVNIVLPELDDLKLEVIITDVTDEALYFKPANMMPLPTTTHIPERGYKSSWGNIYEEVTDEPLIP